MGSLKTHPVWIQNNDKIKKCDIKSAHNMQCFVISSNQSHIVPPNHQYDCVCMKMVCVIHILLLLSNDEYD